MTTDNPFDGREHGGLVFRTPLERIFFIGRLSPSQQEKWLRDHLERWQTREEALRDLRARAGTDVEAEPPEARSTTSVNEVRLSGEVDGPLPAPAEDKRLPDKPPMNTAPLTSADAEATAAAADDEITIGEPRFISERRIAAMLENSQRQWDTREQVLRTRVTMRSDAGVTDRDPRLGKPSRETASLPRAQAATTEAKGSKAESTLPATAGRKRGNGSQLGKQKPPAGIKLSPKIMRIVLNSLKKYPIQWHAANKAGIHRKTLEYWLKRSAAGDVGYDLKWEGIEWRFHEHCKSAIAEARQILDDEMFQRALGYDKVLTGRGRVMYKIDRGLAGLGIQGPDAYLRDENGNPVPESVRKVDNKAQQSILKRFRPETWSRQPKTDAPRDDGVLIIGGVNKKPKRNTVKSVEARRWKADSTRLREEKD
jgi:hypothetical protein